MYVIAVSDLQLAPHTRAVEWNKSWIVLDEAYSWSRIAL